MDTLSPEALQTAREIIALLAAFVSGVASVITALGLRRRLKEAQAARQNRRVSRLALASHTTRARAVWYTRIYRALCCVPSLRPDEGLLSVPALHALTVQEACAHLGDELPGWAVDGWERCPVGVLNQPSKMRA